MHSSNEETSRSPSHITYKMTSSASTRTPAKQSSATICINMVNAATTPSASTKFTDNYELLETLGAGAFAVVKKCVQKSTGLEFAAKIINIKDMSLQNLEFLEREERIGRKLKHPNIVQLHDSIREEGSQYFVLDLITGGELFYAIAAREFYSEADASYCMQQILEGVHYCHQNDIVHRDLKPENLLLASRVKGATLKLADFGLALEVHGDEQALYGFAGTPIYMAPELLKSKPYGKPVDLWACGAILFLMVFGQPPFYHPNEYKLFARIKIGAFNFPSSERDKATPDVKDIISRMLTVNPAKRITAAEALKHPWISQRRKVASRTHRQDTIVRLRQFNARRKFKGAILAILMVVRRKYGRQSIAAKKSPTASAPHEDAISPSKEEIVMMTKELLDSITRGNYEGYTKLCDPHITAFEPEAMGNMIQGVKFHKFYFDNITSKNCMPVNTTILNPHIYFLGEDAAYIAYIRLTQYMDTLGTAYTQRSEETRIWHRRDGKWQNVHYHRSATASSPMLLTTK